MTTSICTSNRLYCVIVHVIFPSEKLIWSWFLKSQENSWEEMSGVWKMTYYTKNTRTHNSTGRVCVCACMCCPSNCLSCVCGGVLGWQSLVTLAPGEGDDREGAAGLCLRAVPGEDGHGDQECHPADPGGSPARHSRWVLPDRLG